MRRLDVAVEARIAVAAALAVSFDEFGLSAAERYRALIQQAYRDLIENPERPGVAAPEELPGDIRLYPIRYANARMSKSERVGHPRHIIAFRYDTERVEIVQFLHDSMDFPARLS